MLPVSFGALPPTVPYGGTGMFGMESTALTATIEEAGGKSKQEDIIYYCALVTPKLQE